MSTAKVICRLFERWYYVEAYLEQAWVSTEASICYLLAAFMYQELS